MKHMLRTVAAACCVALLGTQVAMAADVQLMDGLVPREGDNPLTKPGQFKKAPPYKIGFSVWGFGNTWEIQMTHEAEYEASRHPEIAKFIVTNAESKAAKQVSDIEDLLSQGVDALIVAPISLTAVSPVIAKAAAMGIPVIVHSTAVDTDKFTVDLQGDPIHFGEVGGKFLADTLKGKGDIWVLRGQAGISEDQYRYDGMKKGLAGSQIKIVSEQYGDWSYDKGKQICESMLLSNPHVDGIWSSGGDMSRACIEVFNEMGQKVPPITGEGNNGFLKTWKASGTQAIAAVFQPEQGPAAVRAALALLEGEQLHHRYVARPAPITAAERDTYVRPDLSDNYWVPSNLPESLKQKYFGHK